MDNGGESRWPQDLLRHLRLAPEGARSFLRRLLMRDPNARCSAEDALQEWAEMLIQANI